jgi:hypothetical protein
MEWPETAYGIAYNTSIAESECGSESDESIVSAPTIERLLTH